MTNYWAIAIGINQYQQFQPLMYAQHDALALRNYWVNSAGFAPERCLLFTDISPAFAETATYPNRENIQTYITRLCQEQLHSGDFLWCFFSGYGVQFDGKDYLMPIEGNPAQASTTGIAVEALFNTLRTAPTDKILLVLDMNRSLGVRAGDRVGAQTATLAETYQIPTILSCAPDQFSHETLALRHGLFTAALLEGMRFNGCLTLNQLVQYVRDRVLELSDHHWRPQQHPVAIIPAQMQYQFVIPQPEIAAVGAGVGGSTAFAASKQPETSFKPQVNGFAPIAGSVPTSNGVGTNGAKPHSYSENGSNSHHPLVPVMSVSGEAKPDGSTTPESASSEISDDLFWRRLLLWGGAIALALLLLVLVRNQAVLFRSAPVDPAEAERSSSPPPQTNPASGDSSFNAADSAANNAANNAGGSNPSTNRNATDNTTTKPSVAPSDEPAAFFNWGTSEQSAEQAGSGEQPSPTETNRANSNPNLNGSQPNSSSGSTDSSSDADVSQAGQGQAGQEQAGQGQTSNQANNQAAPTQATIATLNEARTALRSRQYEQALNQLDRVPTNQRNQDYEQLRRQASQGLLNEARALLNETRNSSRVNQASDFSRAIAKAQRIRPDNPLYAQAQQDIERWNQVIWDIAQGRASRGNYENAIAAAKLIPARQSSLYPTAQSSIAEWQQSQANQAVIQQARALIQRSQASSYNRAIAKVRNIGSDQPLYDEAQLLKNEWSAAILTIARTRAAQGKYRDAIQTAVLVPRDTPTYQSAQAAIAQWSNR